MFARIDRSGNVCAALFSAMICLPSPVQAGSELVGSDKTSNFFLGAMLHEFCVQSFPRFAKAPGLIDAVDYFERRKGQKVWDHTNLAVTLSLTKLEGKPACVMSAVTRKWPKDTWAAYAATVFDDKTWESDQTIVDKGQGKPDDKLGQHMRVRFPTHEMFTFDADRRSDGLWTYTIALIAAK